MNSLPLSRLLSEMVPGDRGVVTKIADVESITNRLLDLGVVENSEIEVIRLAPLGGDPMLVKIRGGLLGLRKKEAALVTVNATVNTTEAE